MKIDIFQKGSKILDIIMSPEIFLIGFKFSDDFKRSPKKHSKFQRVKMTKKSLKQIS